LAAQTLGAFALVVPRHGTWQIPENQELTENKRKSERRKGQACAQKSKTRSSISRDHMYNAGEDAQSGN